MSKKSINEYNTFDVTTSLSCAMKKSVYHMLGNNVGAAIKKLYKVRRFGRLHI